MVAVGELLAAFFLHGSVFMEFCSLGMSLFLYTACASHIGLAPISHGNVPLVSFGPPFIQKNLITSTCLHSRSVNYQHFCKPQLNDILYRTSTRHFSSAQDLSIVRSLVNG